MGLTEFIDKKVDAEIQYREATKIAKDICIPGLFYLNPTNINYFSCDLNGLAFYSGAYACAEDEAVRALGEKSIQALYDMGYPCYNSLLYSISRKNNNMEEAKKHLNAAIAQKEPGSDYLLAHYLLAENVNDPKALAQMKQISVTPSHPCKKLAQELIENIEEKSKGCLHYFAKFSKLFVKIMIVVFALLVIAAGNGIIKTLIGAALVYGIGKLISKVFGFFAKSVKEELGAPTVDNEHYYFTTGTSHNHATYTHPNPLFNANISYSHPTIYEVNDGYMLPCDIVGNYMDSYEYIDLDYNTQYKDEVDKPRMKQDYVTAVTTLLEQIYANRRTKKPVFMEACKQGDKAATTALSYFFGLKYQDGTFMEDPESFYSFMAQQYNHICKYFD